MDADGELAVDRVELPCERQSDQSNIYGQRHNQAKSTATADQPSTQQDTVAELQRQVAAWRHLALEAMKENERLLQERVDAVEQALSHASRAKENRKQLAQVCKQLEACQPLCMLLKARDYNLTERRPASMTWPWPG